MNPTHRRRTKFRIVLAVLALGLMEGVAHLAILVTASLVEEPIRRVATIYAEQSRLIARVLDTAMARPDRLDPELGWRYAPGYATPNEHINASGLRALREYDVTAPAGRLRVAAFGSSFIYAGEVADADAWSAQLESLEPDFEVLNYGVGLYGIDQAYLRYLREGDTYHPDVVLIGIGPASLRRTVSVYPRFLSTYEAPLVKPRFVLDDADGLRQLSDHIPRRSDYERYLSRPEEIRQLGRYDQWYEPMIYENPLYDWSAVVRLCTTVWLRTKRRLWEPDRWVKRGVLNERSEAFRIQVEVTERFARAARERRARPLVVFIPDRPSVGRAISGAPLVYAPLEAALETRGIAFLDLAPFFAARAAGEAKVTAWFMPGGHYSAAGNRIVAEVLRDYLKAWEAKAEGSVAEPRTPSTRSRSLEPGSLAATLRLAGQ